MLSLHTEIGLDGQVRDHNVLRLQWTTRLLEAAGILAVPKEWGAPSVPHDAPEEVQAVFQAYLHVRRIRAVTRAPDAPFPFSLRFIQDWLGQACAWSFHFVKKAKAWLVRRGYLVAEGADGKGERLWRLGRHALRRARVEAPMLSTEAATVADVAATVPALPPTGSACPDSHEPDHTPQTCAICRAQQRLEERRAQEGIWHNPHDPYGWKGSSGGVSILN